MQLVPTLQNALTDFNDDTLYMMEFTRRHGISCRYGSNPPVYNCSEAIYYRPGEFAKFLEVRSLLFSATTENGENAIILIENRARNLLNSTTKIASRFKRKYNKGLHFGEQLEDPAVLGLSPGRINALSVKRAAEHISAKLYFLITDELYLGRRSFSQNTGAVDRSIVVHDSSSFYQALASETPNVFHLPLMDIADLRNAAIDSRTR